MTKDANLIIDELEKVKEISKNDKETLEKEVENLKEKLSAMGQSIEEEYENKVLIKFSC